DRCHPRRLLHESELLRRRRDPSVTISRTATRRVAALGAVAALVALGWGAAAAGAAGFDPARAFRDVERFVGLGPRPSGSAAIGRARAYLLGELRHAGWRVREQAFSAPTPRGPISMVNVIAEWPGRRPEVVAVGGQIGRAHV